MLARREILLYIALFVVLAITVSFSAASPLSKKQADKLPAPRPASAEDVVGKTYDYVIIGGGTAGLTMATRLSEMENMTVAVLEAGTSHLGDENVDMPGKMGYPLGNNSYDWSYMTSPQEHAYNLTFGWSRGKGLGGSSALNFMIGNRGAKEEYDAWEELGNTGWNFDNLLPHFKKAEHFEAAPNVTFAKEWNETYDPSSHGFNGPLSTSPSTFQSDAWRYWFDTGDKFGLPPYTTDAYGGSPMGQYTALDFAKHDKDRRVRSYAASAYWAPHAVERSNLIVATNAPVQKIVLKNSTDSRRARAIGAQLTTGGIVKARREVILSGGAIVSPQILELSGIGNRTILEQYNISTIVELPGVGENLQDRPYTLQSFELTPNAWLTADNATNDAVYRRQQEDLWRQGKNSFYSFAPTWVAYIPFSSFIAGDQLTKLATAQEKEASRIPSILNDQFAIQQRWIQETNSTASSVPAVELLYYPGVFPHMTVGDIKPDRNYMTIMAELQHPFFRGSIHINSTNVTNYPVIDPHYFEYDYDTQLVSSMAQAVHKFAHTAPMSSIVGRDNSPNSSVKTNAEWIDFSKRNLFSSAHAVGTCAMGKRHKGGVLDENLRVHGTDNLRVVDVSVFPLHVSAHPSMTVYAIAERAADLIKQAIK